MRTAPPAKLRVRRRPVRAHQHVDGPEAGVEREDLHAAQRAPVGHEGDVCRGTAQLGADLDEGASQRVEVGLVLSGADVEIERVARRPVHRGRDPADDHEVHARRRQVRQLTGGAKRGDGHPAFARRMDRRNASTSSWAVSNAARRSAAERRRLRSISVVVDTAAVGRRREVEPVAECAQYLLKRRDAGVRPRALERRQGRLRPAEPQRELGLREAAGQPRVAKQGGGIHVMDYKRYR